ncbi:hypothetical protein ACXYMX_15935 [Sporosarcina sp. CAU 1771]
MTVVKKVSIFCSLVLIIAIGGFGLYEWFAKGVVNASTLFFVALGISFFFQSITWGEMEGKHEGDKDEMEKHITLLSSKVSYFVLLFLMFIVLVVSEKVFALNDIKNIPLVLVISLAVITLPITEYVVAKKYR